MNLKLKALKKSLWVYHVSGGSCNNCDIEILDLLTPRFDVERFGIILAASPRHADVLLCTGIVNKKCVERIKEVYEQTPKPCVVVAIGACACSGGIFRDGYQMAGPLNKIIPVDVYIPGCPPKPEAIIAGIVKFLKELK
ncbi:MAG TPA: NADH-quinone oxidoreductase subunit B family protein [bacterium]|nr:NADH-quinone oxidoreductase subunit B family protein [bacterium]HOM26238.1 NADH-quinone oxidoreductase subunit B family protein [bacterium]